MVRRRGTNAKGRKFPNEVVSKVWEKGTAVPGKNPDLYRYDPTGKIIYRPSYGKGSRMGWEIDHKKPVSKGGSDNPRNLQPLQTEENKEKSDQYPWKP